VIDTLSNTGLIALAREYGGLSILETELVKRLDVFVQEDIRKQERTARFFTRTDEQVTPQVRKIVEWARDRA
jgi:hypothetical protein